VVRDTAVTTLADVADLPAVANAVQLDLTGTQVADLGWLERVPGLRELRLIGAPAAGGDQARALAERGVTVID